MNGKYIGNYIFCEKITQDEGRIEIQDISDFGKSKYTDINGDDVIDLKDGGFILEIDVRKDAEFYFTSKEGVVFTLKDPDNVSEDILDYIKKTIQKAEDILFDENFKNENEGWKKYFDINSFIDWYLVNEFSKYHDSSFQTSVYLYFNPKDEKIHMGPNWDFDLGFGNSGEKYTDYKSDGWLIKNAKWISRFFEDESFVSKVKSRWNEK
ncbi:CotH kinase family protein, partial [Treponema sp. JC4]|uniref:CotH kinase family protein n=1 Tax=Treponema sp. JC4 TaxID=1124982 RepID=UPI00178C27E0